jgi:hypothetical protein
VHLFKRIYARAHGADLGARLIRGLLCALRGLKCLLSGRLRLVRCGDSGICRGLRLLDVFDACASAQTERRGDRQN